MKRIRNTLVVALAMMLLSGLALAQDNPNGQRPRGGRRGQGPRMGRGEGEGGRRGRGEGEAGGRRRGQGRGGLRQGQRLQQVLAQLELTEVQKTKIAAIVAEHNAPMQAAQEAMREARRSGDEEAIQAARETLRKLQAERGGGPSRKLLRRIAAELNKTQRERFLYLMGPGGPFAELLTTLRTMELEPAVTRKIRQIAARAKAAARMKTDDKEKAKVYDEARKKIMNLLTDEQKAELRRKIAARNRGGRGGAAMLEALNLSAEQQEAIAAIRAEAEEGGNPRAVFRRIFSEVLTDEQKEQFRRQMQQRRPRGGGEGGGRRGPGGPNAGEGGGGRRGPGGPNGGGGGEGRPARGRGDRGPNGGDGENAE